jgi:DNA polymerase-1
MGKGIRKAFEANEKDHMLISADYSQIELRLLAHFSEDKVLVKAYENNEDIHKRTAMEVFDVSADEVDGNMRRSAKVINFGILYGMGPDGLSKALKQPRATCKEFIERFFERYPGVREYMDGNVAFGREHGYVQTLLGRRKYYRDLNSDNGMLRAGAERAAVNMPLQGSASDIIKLAMVRLNENLENEGLKGSILLQVHDELVLSVPGKRVKEISELVGYTMSNVEKLKVQMVVNVKAGPDWLDMESVGDYSTAD